MYCFSPKDNVFGFRSELCCRNNNSDPDLTFSLYGNWLTTSLRKSETLVFEDFLGLGVLNVCEGILKVYFKVLFKSHSRVVDPNPIKSSGSDLKMS